MRPLRYSINVTLDGCCDHRAIAPDEDLHRYHTENLARADALLFGRVTYEMMEAAWREPARTGARPDWMQPWMEPFARTIDAAKKYVVSSTLDRVDWKREASAGVDRDGTDRRVRVRGASQAGGPRADVVRGAIEACRPQAREPAGTRLGRGRHAV
jgi:hypothetical protein